jgi:hypothetical protein
MIANWFARQFASRKVTLFAELQRCKQRSETVALGWGWLID